MKVNSVGTLLMGSFLGIYNGLGTVTIRTSSRYTILLNQEPGSFVSTAMYNSKYLGFYINSPNLTVPHIPEP